MRTITATRYVTPLREGGSLPGIIEADDDGLYVMKFRGAGQGLKALVAELVAGEIARALELPVPEIVFVDLDPILGRSEPDFEVQNLIKASAGVNLALDYLPGSLTFDAADALAFDSHLASRIVWFDAFVTNVDRTSRNTNLLVWHKKLYLIDHGASLYFQHNWASHREHFRNPFVAIRDHVLLCAAAHLQDADVHSRERLSADRLSQIVDLIPEDWLMTNGYFKSAAECRQAYLDLLSERLGHSEVFVTEARNARTRIV